MKHARPDYDRIQDPYGKIPDDEPVFLLRGQDSAAHGAVKAWANIAERHGASPQIVRYAREHAERMRLWALKWAEEHESEDANKFGKTPDMPLDV